MQLKRGDTAVFEVDDLVGLVDHELPVRNGDDRAGTFGFEASPQVAFGGDIERTRKVVHDQQLRLG